MDEGGTAADNGDSSLYRRIMADIEGRILSGEWSPGHRIPFEVDLARDYDCSRMTVNKALSQLAKNGLIERRRRSGSFVRIPTSQSAVLEIRDIASEVAALGMDYGYRLLSRRARKATAAERERLGLSPGGRVLHLLCLHSAGPAPFCLEDRLVNLAAVPGAEDEPFVGIAPGLWLLRQVPWSTAEHTVSATEASAETAELLAIRPGRACLVVERRTAMAKGFVTLVRLTYPGDRHALVARFTPAQAMAAP